MWRGNAATLGKMRSHGWVFVRDAITQHGRGTLADLTQKIPILRVCPLECAVFAETRRFCEYKIPPKGDFTVNEWLIGGL